MKLKWRVLLIAAVAAIAIALAWRLGYFELDRRENVVAAMRHARSTPWAMPIYFAAYVSVVVLVLPATVLTFLGGALFGTPYGLVLAWGGSLAGSALAHMIARSVGRAPAKRFFGRHRLLRHMRDRAGLWTLVRLRVIPLGPFGVLSYVAGLAGVRLRVLLAATAIAIIPATTAYAYAGEQLAASIWQGGPESRRGLAIAAGVTVAMVVLSLLPLLFRDRNAERESSAKG